MNTAKLIGLCLLAAPGSFALLAIALRELVRAVRKSRQASTDAERAERIAREYMVPDFAVLEVPEPTGRRARPTELPEITSNYREEPRRG